LAEFDSFGKTILLTHERQCSNFYRLLPKDSAEEADIYKLLAKKKVDGTIEWAYFVQRDSGVKERVMRGAVKTAEEFSVVKDAIESNLRRIYGFTLQAAGYDVSTLNRKTATGTMH
jgi:hypothetical protein